MVISTSIKPLVLPNIRVKSSFTAIPAPSPVPTGKFIILVSDALNGQLTYEYS